MPTSTYIANDSALIASVLAGDAAACTHLLAYAETFARTHIRRSVPSSAHDDLVNGFLAHLSDGNWRRLRAWRAEAPLAHNSLVSFATINSIFCVRRPRARPLRSKMPTTTR